MDLLALNCRSVFNQASLPLPYFSEFVLMSSATPLYYSRVLIVYFAGVLTLFEKVTRDYRFN